MDAEEEVDPRSIKLPPELSWARERWLDACAVILILHPIVGGIAIIWKHGLWQLPCRHGMETLCIGHCRDVLTHNELGQPALILPATESRKRSRHICCPITSSAHESCPALSNMTM